MKNTFLLFLIILQLGIPGGVFANTLVFTNEDSVWDGSTFLIDINNDTVGSAVDLKFGQDVDARIQFDRVANTLKVNRDLDLENNEIKNVRIDNLAVAPICDGPSSGRMYFNTVDSHTYSCDGSQWEILDEFTVNESEQTLDYNVLEGGTIFVLSDTSTNRPSDHQYIVKTLGNTALKTQVATRANGNQRYFRIFQSLSWTDWREIKTKKYGGYTIQDIDQTDGTASYIGRTRDSDDKWLITLSVPGGFSYAQEENNSGITDFTTAWSNRLTLVYGSAFE